MKIWNVIPDALRLRGSLHQCLWRRGMGRHCRIEHLARHPWHLYSHLLHSLNWCSLSALRSIHTPIKCPICSLISKHQKIIHWPHSLATSSVIILMSPTLMPKARYVVRYASPVHAKTILFLVIYTALGANPLSKQQPMHFQMTSSSTIHQYRRAKPLQSERV